MSQDYPAERILHSATTDQVVDWDHLCTLAESSDRAERRRALLVAGSAIAPLIAEINRAEPLGNLVRALVDTQHPDLVTQQQRERLESALVCYERAAFSRADIETTHASDAVSVLRKFSATLQEHANAVPTPEDHEDDELEKVTSNADALSARAPVAVAATRGASGSSLRSKRLAHGLMLLAIVSLAFAAGRSSDAIISRPTIADSTTT